MSHDCNGAGRGDFLGCVQLEVAAGVANQNVKGKKNEAEIKRGKPKLASGEIGKDADFGVVAK